MSDRIVITGVAATGYHGVFAEERRDGQLFVVDAILYLDLLIAGTNDKLVNTVDYSKVALLIHEIVIDEPFDLIERLGEEIADRILNSYSLVHSVEVTVHKPLAPIGIKVEDIAIVIVRSR